ncbi:ATP-binding protein [Acrocarpospora phusangensis]|uniref:ATP-binding protein n=1 Tax=Acrocarpospora phusangensis TaxID=1070424 RepID=A0A919UN95_9ACTN|nr:ATP-binding protein [Acrocarpospora phusangensis]GIH27694.1 ATP-binding protein [Acrocarpospora phusangensis]
MRSPSPRSGTGALEIAFPPRALVLLTGLPGAGKSTLLDQLYGLRGDETRPVLRHGALVIDSRQARVRWARLLPRLPRRGRSLVVHLTHVWRIARALPNGHPVVAHSRAAWPHLLYGFALLARLTGRQLHVVMLDVPAVVARAGQIARGRIVSETTFARHRRRWGSLLTRARSGELPPAHGVRVLDRPSADRLRRIVFERSR